MAHIDWQDPERANQAREGSVPVKVLIDPGHLEMEKVQLGKVKFRT